MKKNAVIVHTHQKHAHLAFRRSTNRRWVSSIQHRHRYASSIRPGPRSTSFNFLLTKIYAPHAVVSRLSSVPPGTYSSPIPRPITSSSDVPQAFAACARFLCSLDTSTLHSLFFPITLTSVSQALYTHQALLRLTISAHPGFD